jgi:hypothetical protein
MINSEELIGITYCLTIYTRCGINRCRYNRVRLYFDRLRTYDMAVTMLRTMGFYFLQIVRSDTFFLNVLELFRRA